MNLRIEEIYNNCSNIVAEANNIKVRYSNKKKTLEKLTESKGITLESLELAKDLINEDAGKFIGTLEGLLTLAVQKIFYDVKDPKVRLIVKEGARNSASIQYEYINHNGTKIKSDVRKAVGGGVRCVIGFVLQTFFISYYKLERVIFADEAFKELSKQYRPYFIEFLKELGENSNFKFLMITHDDDIVENADYIYKMDNGVLKKVGGSND